MIISETTIKVSIIAVRINALSQKSRTLFCFTLNRSFEDFERKIHRNMLRIKKIKKHRKLKNAHKTITTEIAKSKT